MTILMCIFSDFSPYSGGISNLEMFSIANDAVEELAKSNITVRRMTVGTVMVSQSCAIFQL